MKPSIANEAAALLRGPVVAVMNLGSGGVDVGAIATMSQILDDAGVAQREVVGVEPAELDLALERAVARAELVIVLGGDGTIRSAAIKCGAARKILMPLGGGTMNMLPRALYGERSWREAVADTLAKPNLTEVSGGLVEDEMFFCAAILGAPALWADAREAARRVDLVGAARCAVAAIRRRRSSPLRYQFDQDPFEAAQAVAIICPLVSRALDSAERSLEAAAIEPPTAAMLFRLAYNAVFDDWRADPAVRLEKVRTARIAGHGRIPALVDGERIRLGRLVNVRFEPRAFTAVVPA